MLKTLRHTITPACLAIAVLATPAAMAEDRQVMPNSGDYKSPDGDNVNVNIANGTSGTIRVCLGSASSVTWWKSVEVFGSNGWPLGRVETQDNNHGPNCTDLATSQFDPNNSRILLLKAKAFGAHTGIVSFVFRPSDYDGKSINVMWNRD